MWLKHLVDSFYFELYPYDKGVTMYNFIFFFRIYQEHKQMYRKQVLDTMFQRFFFVLFHCCFIYTHNFFLFNKSIHFLTTQYFSHLRLNQFSKKPSAVEVCFPLIRLALCGTSQNLGHDSSSFPSFLETKYVPKDCIHLLSIFIFDFREKLNPLKRHLWLCAGKWNWWYSGTEQIHYGREVRMLMIGSQGL